MRFPFSDHDINDNDPVIFVDPHSPMAQMLADTVASTNPQDDPFEMVVRLESLLIQRTGKNIVQTYSKTVITKTSR